MPEIVIIGAGPTGLGAATRLEQLARSDWILLEKDTVPGGLSASVVDENGFTWDMGGHVTFSHYQYFDQFLDEVVKEWNSHKRAAWILLGDRWVPYPFQNSIRFLSKEDQTRCLQGLMNRPSSTPGNFQEWIDVNFGSGISELFLNPYNSKVWAHPPRGLSTEWVDERVATVDLNSVIDSLKIGDHPSGWGPNAEFRFPAQGGTGRVWREAAARLPQHRIRYQSEVQKIDVHKRIVHTKGGSYPYEHLISTMPLDLLIEMIKTDKSLDGYVWPVHSSVHVVGIGLSGEPTESICGFSWMYFPDPGIPFFRATLFSSYASGNAPPDCWSLLLEVSESSGKPVHGDIVEQCIAASLRAGMIRPEHRILSRFHRKIDYAYPIPYLGRNEFLARAESQLAAHGILSRGRFGAWKYEVGNQDHSFMQGVESADRIVCGAEESTYSRPQLVNRNKQVGRAFKAASASDRRSRLFENIKADLAPWQDQGITRELFERIKHRSWKGLHVKIIQGRIQIHKETPSVGTRNECTTLMLREAASRYRLPDCEFIIHTADDPPASNLPMFAFCKHKNDKTILFPDFSFYSYLEALLPSIDRVRVSLDHGSRWEEKSDRVLCLGAGTHPMIKEWAQREYGWLEVRTGDWTKNRAALPSLEELSHWKYLAPLAGNSYSPILKHLFLTNSLVIYDESEWLEFWHSILDYGIDCIRHDFTAPASIDRLHDKLEGLPAQERQQIAAQGYSKVSQTLTLDIVYEYIAGLISDYAGLLRFPVAEKEYRLIVARHSEDVSWSDGHPRIVYNKGQRIGDLPGGEQIMLPNVGRESHTYLTYIIDNYNNLPECVMFCQGTIKDHVDGFRIEDFINPDYDIVYARLSILKEWDPASGRLMYPRIWQEKLDKGSMRPAGLTYVEWFDRVLGMPLSENTVYIPGAIFSVSSKAIHKRPIKFYAGLREFVKDHPNPEEGHYLERSWLYIFALKDIRVLHLN
jgi:protoporphyrinogen oxidase